MTRGGRGFTFIELTVVCGIIAILAAILFPVFAKAQAKARGATCLNNLQHIGMGLRLYAEDNGGAYPPRDNDLTPLHPRYLSQADVFLCPEHPPQMDAAPDLNASYLYRGGLHTDAPGTEGLAADRRAWHSDGANVLFGDGRARWLSESALMSDPQARGGLPPPAGLHPPDESGPPL